MSDSTGGEAARFVPGVPIARPGATLMGWIVPHAVGGVRKEGAMMTEENAAIVLRYFLGTHNAPRNMAVIDELCSPEYGARMRAHIAAELRAFPDMHFTVEEVVAADERVVLRWSARGTHRGELPSRLGPLAPTGKAATATCITIYHVVEGKIVGEMGIMDTIGLYLQLGILAPPEHVPC
jgi:predicted ester cyclase